MGCELKQGRQIARDASAAHSGPGGLRVHLRFDDPMPLSPDFSIATRPLPAQRSGLERSAPEEADGIAFEPVEEGIDSGCRAE